MRIVRHAHRLVRWLPARLGGYRIVLPAEEVGHLGHRLGRFDVMHAGHAAGLRGGDVRLDVVDEDALLNRIRGRAEEAANKGEPVRRDDNPEVFKTRLDVYREQTAPVTEYYRSQGLLNIVDGLQPIDAVTEQLTATLAALPSDQIRSDVR